MKRFLAFAGDYYYAMGGWGDFIGSFDSLDDAKAACVARKPESPSGHWGSVVDSETEAEVAQWQNNRPWAPPRTYA